MIIRILKYGTVTILILALGFLGIATINQHNKLRQAQLDERLASQLNNHDSTETASGFNTLSSTKDKTNASTVKSNGSTAQMLGFKPFVPSVCTTTLLPYRTTYENVSFLATGKTQVFIYGLNGSLRHCTPDSTGFAPIDVTYKPTDQVVWVGTGTSSGTTQYSYSDALRIAQNNCSAYSNSSAYQPCVQAYLHKFGY